MVQDLGLVDDSDRRSHVVSKGTSHGESWDVLLLDPHPIRAHLVPVLVSVGEDPASIHLDPQGLSLILSLVVS